ncbi:stage II sporulation protein P [Halalkalibacter akibai]|uniref:Stage II sporulation protein P n=1 Tax=Halalkalibacter akibai (strain ATCC 43226 / DSM 21942 / CIP 109018 / JCM 9157 / 1139) TaxID=1236973 RepID=W4QTD3_HALA3|nr:stage II sporulation protein P [Halalkalibacter akibai]GAE35162.1 stage II sporulation protein P [Halalkalibacter akibai JCM 9157]
MDKKEDQDILNELKRKHAALMPSNQFKNELEDKLILKFSKKRNFTSLIPAFGLSLASIIFFILFINSEALLTNTMNIPSEPPQVYILHTHNYESFVPDLENLTASDVPVEEAQHHDLNITLVGEYLSKQLHDNGINAIQEKRDVQSDLLNKGWMYSKSYDISRIYTNEVLKQHDSIELILDIHRDSLPRNRTTMKYNDEDVARIVFVVNGNHSNYQPNLSFAEKLNQRLEEYHPGLSRGVILRQGAFTNHNYNQDLSEKSILLEIGGPENTIEEVNKAAGFLAEVIVEVLKEK